jgi:hypothetical protein
MRRRRPRHIGPGTSHKVDPSASLPVGFWLVPAPPHHQHLTGIIDSLARELNAPRFEPHVTLYAGARGPDDDVAALLHRAAEQVEPLDLRVRGIGTTSALFKTLYLEFEPEPRIEQLCRLFRAGLQPALDYELNPHLSLLYKELPATTRSALTTRFDFNGQRIRFAQIAATRPGGSARDWLDVEKWDAWFRRDLGSQSSDVR